MEEGDWSSVEEEESQGKEKKVVRDEEGRKNSEKVREVMSFVEKEWLT